MKQERVAEALSVMLDSDPVEAMERLLDRGAEPTTADQFATVLRKAQEEVRRKEWATRRRAKEAL